MSNLVSFSWDLWEEVNDVKYTTVQPLVYTLYEGVAVGYNEHNGPAVECRHNAIQISQDKSVEKYEFNSSWMSWKQY